MLVSRIVAKTKPNRNGLKPKWQQKGQAGIVIRVTTTFSKKSSLAFLRGLGCEFCTVHLKSDEERSREKRSTDDEKRRVPKHHAALTAYAS